MSTTFSSLRSYRATSAGKRILPLLLFSIVVGLYCAWVLLLPIFPSQDGPMHLYFTNVLMHLLAHSSPLYEHFYSIRHLLPPYSLYYYLLIALSRFVPLVWADKVVVAVAVANLAFGLRYLFMARGRSGEFVAMLVFPVLLNWPLFMGFVNFALSLGLAAWAIGVWSRLESASTIRQRTSARVIFALLLVTMTLTHPVPLGLVLVFCAGDVFLRALDFRRLRTISGSGGWRRAWWLDMVVLVAAGSCCVGYVSAFTVRHIARQAQPAPPMGVSLQWLVAGHGLMALAGHHPATLFYKAGVFLALLIGLVLSVTQVVRARRAGHRELPRWLIFTVVVMVALPLTPPDLNSSHLFRDRLVIVVWISALAAGSDAVLSRRAEWALTLYGTVIAMIVLAAVHTEIWPMAGRIAEIERVPLDDHGPMGLLLPAKNESVSFTLFFDPYEWAGAHFTRRANGVLVDTPWLDLPIIPLEEKQGLLTGKMDALHIEDFDLMRKDLLHSAAARELIYSKTNYVILVDETRKIHITPLDPVLAADTTGSWKCENADWFLLCDRRSK